MVVSTVRFIFDDLLAATNAESHLESLNRVLQTLRGGVAAETTTRDPAPCCQHKMIECTATETPLRFQHMRSNASAYARKDKKSVETCTSGQSRNNHQPSHTSQLLMGRLLYRL